MGRKNHCTAAEKKIAMNLRNEGKSLRQIAKSLGRSVCFVQNAFRSKVHIEKRGWEKKSSDTTDTRIVRLAKNDPFMSSEAISAEIGNEISSQTACRRLKNAGLPGRIARKVPFIRGKNFSMRRESAKYHLAWSGPEGSKKWSNILWSDETKINLFGNDSSRYVRRPKGEEFDPRYTKKTIKHGDGCIMVWGYFSWYGVGPIHRIRGTMTQFGYRNIMTDIMLPYAEENMPLRWVYQQDNDPKHTAKLVKAWFTANKVVVMDWPSQSPDLNPIENLWGDLKRRIGTNTFQNAEELWEFVQKTWYEIPVETCRKLIASMPKRMAQVIQNKGGYTGY